MHDQRDNAIAQANTAIRRLIQSLPNGRITPTARPEYERLLGIWLAAVQAPDDEEPARLAA